MQSSFVFSLGALYEPSIQLLHDLLLRFQASTLSYALIKEVFAYLEATGATNAGAGCSYRNAACIVQNGYFDLKFDFACAYPSKVCYANLQTDELPACCFGPICQNYGDVIVYGKSAAAKPQSIIKTTDTIGCIYHTQSCSLVMSSTGMDSAGRLPPTVMPNIGLGTVLDMSFITTGYGEFLNVANGLNVFLAFTQGQAVYNFYHSPSSAYYDDLVYIYWFIGKPDFEMQALQCTADKRCLNYIYCCKDSIICLISMWYVIVWGTEQWTICMRVLRPLALWPRR